MKLIRRACIAFLVLLPFVDAVAGEGRIPIFEPTTITSSGKYIVTRAFSSPSTTLIDINGSGTEGVEIDLNGFNLGHTVDSGAAIIEADGVKRLVLRNGSIASPGTGTTGIQVTGVLGSASEVLTEVVIEDIKVRNGSSSVSLRDVRTFAIRRCVFSNPHTNGVSISFLLGSPAKPLNSGVFENNTIAKATTAVAINSAIDFSSTGEYRNILLRNNRIESAASGLSAANISSLVVENNTVSAAQSGIRIDDVDGCRITGNVSTSATALGQGLWIADSRDCLIADNVFSGFQTGISVVFSSIRNRIELNLVNDNSIYGLSFALGSTDNIYSRNMGFGNSGAPGCNLGACTAPGVCDQDGGNTSTGDNYMPGSC